MAAPPCVGAAAGSGNDALEFGYRAISGRILGVVLQHDVLNLRIARLENHLRDDVCKFFYLPVSSSGNNKNNM